MLPTPTRRHLLAFATAFTAACQKAAEPGLLGKRTSPYGDRSPFETAARLPLDTHYPETSASKTPLQDSVGILTPSSLHYERHHAGVPRIDPARHRLLLHGLVDRPLIFTVDEIRRMPSVSHIHFLECSGNSGGEWGPKTGRDASQSCGLASCSEWTGVPLSSLRS